jgi:arginine deiminase
VEVFYIENLVAQIFDKSPSLRGDFLNTFIEQGNVENECVKKAIYEFFDSIKDNLEFVRALIAGVKKSEINPK